MPSGGSVSTWSVRVRQVINKLGMLSFDSLSRTRVRAELVDSVTTCATVTTVSTITDTRVGGAPLLNVVYAMNRMGWEQAVGRLIT